METKLTGSSRSQSIDALRGVAVLLVVFLHSFVPITGITAYDTFLSFFYRVGAYGVDLFFVLSGYCIHRAYSKPGAPFGVRNYLVRRWWRIYPPYFFALALAVLLNLATNLAKWVIGGTISLNNFGLAPVLSHIFLVHDFSPKTLATISGPFWTIAMEAQYYLIYLAVRPLFFTRRGWFWVFLSAIALYFISWSMHYLELPFQPFSAFRYWIEWVIGAFLVYWIRTTPDVIKRNMLHLALFIFFCFVTALLGRFAAVSDLTELSVAPAFAFLILFFLGSEKIWAARILNWLPAVGLFSYSIYLIHFLFLDRVRMFVLMALPQGWIRCSVSIGAIGLCLLISYVFFCYFERPYLEKAASIPKY